jgi:putative transposase
MLFLDNGSGFKARMMTAETEGYFSRLSITPSYNIAGNSKGKGLVEGFNGIFRNRHDKKFLTYCGDDMAPEINRRLVDHVKSGKRTLPSYIDYVASVRQYIEDYNNEPKAVLGGKSPREVWQAGLQQVPVHITADALIMPRRIRTVKKWRIRLDNRYYQDAALAQYNNQEVLVEYSLHNDAEIRVLDSEERLICIAYLVNKVARLPDSRIVEMEQKRTAGQIKRLDAKANEVRLRGKPVISLEESNQTLFDITEFNKVSNDFDFNPEDALFLGQKKAAEYDFDSLDSF